MMSESMDVAGDASQRVVTAHITLAEQVPRLNVGIPEVSSLSNLSMVEWLTWLSIGYLNWVHR
jgi:hypothetical protein